MSASPVSFGPGGGTGTSLRVGPVILENAVKVNESGGINAPSKRTEEGFDWTTKVHAEPRTAEFEAWAEVNDVTSITALRDSGEPISVAFDFVTMGKCKLDDLNIDHERDHPEHVFVRVRVTEVYTPSTETAILRVSSSDGSVRSSGPELSDPSLARPEERSTIGGSGSAIDDVLDWLGFE